MRMNGRRLCSARLYPRLTSAASSSCRPDAQRALLLLEEYRAKLNHTEDRQLRHSIQRVIDIFQSNLFQALIDIQEFYEVTLLDSQRWAESSKGADPMAPVNLWDFSSLQSTTVTSDTLPSLSTSIEKYRHHDEDLSPQDQSSPQLTEEGGPELVQVAEKNLSQIENVHGYVTHAHISPMKVVSLECLFDGSLGQEPPSPTSSTLYPHGEDSPLPSCSSNPYPPIQPAAISTPPPRQSNEWILTSHKDTSGWEDELSTMATQEMNADKENPDGRKMEEEEEEEEEEPVVKDKDRFSEAFCIRAGELWKEWGGDSRMQNDRPSTEEPLLSLHLLSDALSPRQPAPPPPPRSLLQEPEEAQRRRHATFTTATTAAATSSMLNSVWYAKKMGRRIMGTLRRTKRLHRRLLMSLWVACCGCDAAGGGRELLNVPEFSAAVARLWNLIPGLSGPVQLLCDVQRFTCITAASRSGQMCGTPAVAHAFPSVA
ncbi:unnamed protein product [Pleuronectes platessa]|uniref:L27 domain-containing protein n=1 Tax=Pleuronectes platessa TaxID=8262 RepID=A0A9N7TPR2_PLEPL|nr:unnamed protein product [Pleuronectes platessa]